MAKLAGKAYRRDWFTSTLPSNVTSQNWKESFHWR